MKFKKGDYVSIHDPDTQGHGAKGHVIGFDEDLKIYKVELDQILGGDRIWLVASRCLRKEDSNYASTFEF